MTIETSRNQRLIERLVGLSDYLLAHPDLPRVNFTSSMGLQVVDHDYRREHGHLSALMAWADSFTDLTVELRPHGKDPVATSVHITSLTDGVRFDVWDTDADDGDLYKWRTPDAFETEIDPKHFAAYVAAGTVEGIER